MTIDERVRAALLDVLPDVYPNIYTGTKLRYIVYQYSTYPRLFADSSPGAAVYSLMVHLYLPHGDNPTEPDVLTPQSLRLMTMKVSTTPLSARPQTGGYNGQI